MMISSSTLILALSVVVVITITTPSDAAVLAPHHHRVADELVFLGTVGDKEFYVGTEEITWVDGKTLCGTNGQELATIGSSEEESFLRDNLWKNESAFSHYFTSGRLELVWDTNNMIIGDSIGSVELNADQECLSIRGGSPYDTLWENRLCSEIWPPVCQKMAVKVQQQQNTVQKIPTAMAVQKDKKISYKLTSLGVVGNKEFFIGSEEISWADGFYVCHKNNQELAVIENSMEEEFLRENLWKDENAFSHYFTSGRFSLVWDTTSTLVGSGIGPIEGFGQDECLTIRGGSEYPTLWDTHWCSDIWPPVCQKIIGE